MASQDHILAGQFWRLLTTLSRQQMRWDEIIGLAENYSEGKTGFQLHLAGWLCQCWESQRLMVGQDRDWKNWLKGKERPSLTYGIKCAFMLVTSKLNSCNFHIYFLFSASGPASSGL